MAVIVGVTSLDLYDACSNIRDMNEIRSAIGLAPLDDLASTTCEWTDKLVKYVPFNAPDCRGQVEKLREQGLVEDALELETSCGEND